MIFNTDGWLHHVFSEEHVKNLHLTVTRPLYLIELIGQTGTEYLSCNGEASFDSDDYVEGVKMTSHILFESSTIQVPASSSRISQIQNDYWGGADCNIYLIPSDPTVPLTFNASDAVLILFGRVESSSFSSDKVSIKVFNKNLPGTLTPGFIFNSFCNHIPPDGLTFEWDGQTQTVESLSDDLVLGQTSWIPK